MTADAAPRPTPETHPLLAALGSPLTPLRPTPLYQLGMLVVAVAMLLLPLAYVVLVAGTAYLTAWYALEGTVVFSGHGAIQIRLLAYITPLFVGTTLVVFMVKPFFAKRAEPNTRLSLDPDQEPLLFEFVAGICHAVGAPKPRRIDVDCEVNASASFRRGMFSLFGNDLVLTLGLPLVAGTDLRQFAGVLAHEFGHFTQGAGMRLSFLIRTVNLWLGRAVHGRDSWDDRLALWSEANGWATIFVGCARAAIWLSRRILWGLMVMGHGLSCFMSRQMEFDADRAQARLTGSALLESTFLRVRLLSLAARGARQDLSHFWKEGHLADDLPGLIVANLDQIPAAVLAEVTRHWANERTHLFDTHPCDKDRVAQASREPAQGPFQAEGPAHQLFQDFAGLCRAATWRHYQELDPGVRRSNLMETPALVRDSLGQQHDHLVASRYFRGASPPLTLLSGPVPARELQAEALKTSLENARTFLVGASVPWTESVKALSEAEERFLEARCGVVLAEAGLRFNPEHFHLSDRGAEGARKACAAEEVRVERARAALEPFLVVHRERLFTALSFLDDGALLAKLEGGAAVVEEAERLLRVGAVLAKVGERLLSLRRNFLEVLTLIRHLKNAPASAVMRAGVKERCSNILRELSNVTRALEDVPYPFTHVHGEVRLRHWVLPEVPTVENPRMFELTHHAVDRLFGLHLRLLNRLASIAEQVESAIELEPLPDPKTAT